MRATQEKYRQARSIEKNNKAAGTDSIAAELLKNGAPQLVDALEEVIQLTWTSETLPESWTKYCAQCKKRRSTRLHQLSRYLSVERCIQSLRQSIIRPFVTLHQCGRSALLSWVPVRQINDRPTLCTAPNP
jgi:hypothetical protein